MNDKTEQSLADALRCTAAGGRAEIINVPGYPLMVRAVDYNTLRADLDRAIVNFGDAAATVCDMRTQLAEAQRDAERGRWLIEHAFRYANVSLGSDMDGNPCVSIEPRFNIPEPTGLEYENGEWSVTDLRAAIDAAKGGGGNG